MVWPHQQYDDLPKNTLQPIDFLSNVRGATAGVRFPAGTRNFSLPHSVHIGLWVPEPFSLGVKRPGREANHSPPSSAEVMNGGAIPLPPHMSSWHNA
jgi:hypothetical protein